MRRIALRSLAHDRGKLIASLAGVAFAATLLLIQIGLYAGFLETSCALIARAGGDVWVMAKGTEVLENGEPLSAGSRATIASHPCVGRVRALVVAFAPTRKAGGAPRQRAAHRLSSPGPSRSFRGRSPAGCLRICTRRTGSRST
jgi:putative ABC transport system permease protein